MGGMLVKRVIHKKSVTCVQHFFCETNRRIGKDWQQPTAATNIQQRDHARAALPVFKLAVDTIKSKAGIWIKLGFCEPLDISERFMKFEGVG